jgi:hypothetical protein
MNPNGENFYETTFKPGPPPVPTPPAGVRQLLLHREGDLEDEELKYCDSFSEIEPEEGDCARVLQFINEFLPVKELAGRLIEVPVLRQFGLVENEQVDCFLATAFGKSEPVKSRRALTLR